MAITCTKVIISPEEPATPYELLTDFNLGWNASAQAIAGMESSGTYSFSVPATSLGVITGLLGDPPVVTGSTVARQGTLEVLDGYNAVSHGFYVNKGKALVIESGVHKTGWVSVGTQVLHITRINGVVKYYVGSTLFYTSAVVYYDPAIIGAFLYSAGDSIVDAEVTAVNVSGALLEPLITRAGYAANVGYAELQPLESRNIREGGTNYLQPLNILAGAGTYAHSVALLEPLITDIGVGEIIPEYALSACSLPYFHAYGTSITDEVGEAIADLEPLTSLSADHAYGISVNTMQPWTMFGGEAWPLDGFLNANLPGEYTLLASGYASPVNGVAASLPKPTLQAFSGASVAAALQMLSLGASSTVSVVGRVDAALPMPTLVANGKVGGASTAYLQHGGQYTTVAHSGAQAVLAHGGRYTTSSEGKIGGVATAAITTAGRYVLLSTGTADNYAVADMFLPALQTAPSGQAWLVGPSLTMHASGGEVVAVTYEAYAINLTTGAVTHYTNYPFDNILRFGSRYYGIAPDGVYLLGGTLDGLDQIDAHIKTFQTNLGTTKQKRVPYVYASGRSDQGVVIGVTADEGDTYEYESAWGEVPGNTNHRVTIGKGIRGVYYALDVKNSSGGSLELDELKALVAPTIRSV